MKLTDDYAKLLSLLEERAVKQTKDGYEFVVKRIPDSDAAGELDPRVLDVLQEQTVKWAAAEAPKLDLEDKFGHALFLRSVMGWDNTDVTRSEIVTRELQVEGTNGSIPLRIYTPSGAQGLLPVVVFFHGGGFIGGTVGVVENPCKALAEKAGAVVVNVDYRLAPEHPFPAGLTDCFETVEWVNKHAVEIRADRSRIAVCGDSAGGNLATVCALMDRDRGSGMIKYQALIYPGLQRTISGGIWRSTP